jgi:hypothetical protein
MAESTSSSHARRAFAQRLAERPLLLDGAMGTLLFSRGTPQRASLDELVLSLANWPRNYLLVRGNASQRGDLEANKQLAAARAQAAKAYLIQAGVNQNRVQAVGGQPSGNTSVSFLLGQPPY